MPELLSQSVVKKLLRAGISHKDQGLISYVTSQANAPSWDMALLRHPELRTKYWKAMVALQEELVPNYISIDDLYMKLWNLFKEVVSNRSVYQIGSKLDEKINEFSRDVKKPLMTFDIIYEIKNFDVGNGHFGSGDVEIFKLTPDYLQGLLLNGETSSLRTDLVKEWAGRSVARVEVSAAEIDRVYESGIIKVNSILNVVRLAAVRERFGQLDDEMFLWELGESISIPRVKPKEGTLLGVSYHRGFLPLIIPMDKIIAKGLENENSWKYILDGKLPEDINRRLIRAIEWISHAITSESLDYKLVNLCTALEILLLPNYRGKTKGELIALRQVLLGRGGHYIPTAILYLYEKRCDIVHNGALGITSHSDYWNLLACCLQTVQNIAHLSQRYPHIPELEPLLYIVENKETLHGFIKHCKQGIYEGHGIRGIKKAAEERLKLCQKSAP